MESEFISVQVDKNAFEFEVKDGIVFLSTINSVIPRATGLYYRVNNATRVITLNNGKFNLPPVHIRKKISSYFVNIPSPSENETWLKQFETLTVSLTKQQETTDQLKKINEDLNSKYIAVKKEFEDLNAKYIRLENDFDVHRLTLNVLDMGEAASELLSPHEKPKKDIPSPLDNISIEWTLNPKSKPLPPMSESLNFTCRFLRDDKNARSHLVKRKRVEDKYLELVVSKSVEIINKVEKRIKCEKDDTKKKAIEQTLYSTISPRTIDSLKVNSTNFLIGGRLI